MSFLIDGFTSFRLSPYAIPPPGGFCLDHAVTYAPSATLLSNLRVRNSASHDSKGLVGNPAFDRHFICPIARGRRRGASHASLYADQSPLIGRDATDEALERMAPVRYSAFRRTRDCRAQRAAVVPSVLASEGRSDGAVFSTEIAMEASHATRDSGCNTADGSCRRRRAVVTARAFQAEFPQWCESLGDEDDDTADFFIAPSLLLR